jgi:hypothetical protein
MIVKMMMLSSFDHILLPMRQGVAKRRTHRVFLLIRRLSCRPKCIGVLNADEKTPVTSDPSIVGVWMIRFRPVLQFTFGAGQSM